MAEATAASDKIRCDACPVICYTKPGAAGACDRYANHDGKLVRVDPHIILERTVEHGGKLVPFQATGDWDVKLVHEPSTFVTAIGAGTTYPDYKPAPFIVSAEVDGVDMVTVVTEGIFSYCGVKVKIDTDRYLGPETATVRAQGEAIGHVTTSEYGSPQRPLGGGPLLPRGAPAGGRAAPRRADGSEQLQTGRTHHRRRCDRGGAGRLSACCQRRGRGAHAGRLRLGDD